MEELENEIVLAGILVLGLDLAKGHRLRLTSLVDRITTDTARRYEGHNRDLGAPIRVSRLRWVERMLIVNQLRGEHDLSAHVPRAKLHLTWRYTFSAATRDEPDRRDYRYDLEDEAEDLWLLSNRPEGNSRFYSELTDYNHDVGVDVKSTFGAWLGLDATVRGGINLMFKDRQVDTRRYHFLDKGPLSRLEEVRAAPLEIAFAPEYVSPEGWQFQEFTRPTDNYFASHRIWALYALADLPLVKGLTLSAGVRVEGSRQVVTTFELFNPEADPDRAVLDDVDPLPAVGLTYRFYEKMLVRAYYARTVNRPDFRELSTATFNDVTGGRQIFGNPDLERATIDNYDLRWEWYPSRHTNISLAGFYKEFHQPIESVVIPSAQFSVTFDNARGARNMGLELAGRLDFGLLHRSLRDLYLAGNLAWIYSRVRLNDEGIQTSQQRPLQGQSPYVINLRLGYDNADLGLTVTLLYNVFGARIMEVGALGAPDVIQDPFHVLDLVIKYKLPRGFSLTFKAKNLIDQTARFTQGSFTVEQTRKGRLFSLGLTKSF
jgi:TonB-dependent receptor